MFVMYSKLIKQLYMFSSPLQMNAFLKQKILKYCRNINPVQKNIQKVTKYTTINNSTKIKRYPSNYLYIIIYIQILPRSYICYYFSEMTYVLSRNVAKVSLLAWLLFLMNLTSDWTQKQQLYNNSGSWLSCIIQISDVRKSHGMTFAIFPFRVFSFVLFYQNRINVDLLNVMLLLETNCVDVTQEVFPGNSYTL